MSIKRILSTPYHPAGNGQAESSNKMTLNIMKKKLENAGGLWPEMLPKVLWAYRTTPTTSTGETPYSLVYGTDVVIPVEVRKLSLRYSNESGPSNDESRRQDLDEAEERRDIAYIRMVAKNNMQSSTTTKNPRSGHSKLGTIYSKTKHRQARIHGKASWGPIGTAHTKSRWR
ncbi:uncharacterized protein [Nicotiana sylvestris]|uniref:uncharacterized protein n=1 Tax=Nicotiana sylvestris TaxID=4096 RepID=UPI00388CDE05